MVTVAFLTDFGLQDSYVGILHGTLLSLLSPEAAAQCQRVDLCHGVTPHRVASGAWQLAQAMDHFPQHTVFVCVVDPGVGNPEQMGLAVWNPRRGHVYIGPNNGVLTPALIEKDGLEVYPVTAENRPLPHSQGPTKAVSFTFWGRDVYTPLAAALVQASAPWLTVLTALGAPVSDPVCITPWPLVPQVCEEALGHGAISPLMVEVLDIDGFGNVILGWPFKDETYLPSRYPWVEVGGKRFPLHVVETYSSIGSPSEGLLCLKGSGGCWELAFNQRRADGILGVSVGDTVSFRA